MVEKEISRKNFLDYASCVTLDYIEYVKTEEELEWGEDRKLLSELPEGSLYITTGDEQPWVQIQIAPGYGISLEPDLAIYWLSAIKKFYDSSR